MNLYCQAAFVSLAGYFKAHSRHYAMSPINISIGCRYIAHMFSRKYGPENMVMITNMGCREAWRDSAPAELR